ncbi:hypothetical protein H0H92_012462, partial [Tricholoma furcatifolium]
ALLTSYRYHKRRDPAPSITFTNAPLQFCYSDVTYDNFLIDPETLEISLIDVDSISILPATLFLEYGLTKANGFSKAVWDQLPIAHSPEVELMDFVRRMLVPCGNPNFGKLICFESACLTTIYNGAGLDNDGQPKTQQLISPMPHSSSEVCPPPLGDRDAPIVY